MFAFGCGDGIVESISCYSTFDQIAVSANTALGSPDGDSRIAAIAVCLLTLYVKVLKAAYWRMARDNLRRSSVEGATRL
jgi:hypothetical protein